MRGEIVEWSELMVATGIRRNNAGHSEIGYYAIREDREPLPIAVVSWLMMRRIPQALDYISSGVSHD